MIKGSLINRLLGRVESEFNVYFQVVFYVPLSKRPLFLFTPAVLKHALIRNKHSHNSPIFQDNVLDLHPMSTAYRTAINLPPFLNRRRRATDSLSRRLLRVYGCSSGRNHLQHLISTYKHNEISYAWRIVQCQQYTLKWRCLDSRGSQRTAWL